MKLPLSLENSTEWVLLGPLGPELPKHLQGLPLLAVDGGAKYSQHIDIWIGDGDSYQEKINCNYIFQFPSQKSLSDLALALRIFSTLSSVTLHLWGFLGGRKDHEWINLGVILTFLETKSQSKAIFYDSQGNISIECLSVGQWSFTHHGIFSLASIRDVKLSLKGQCHYQLEQETNLWGHSSMGLSNVAEGTCMLITQGPVILYYIEDEK